MVQIPQCCGPCPKRLVDGVATMRLAQVQCGECRRGVTEASSTHHQLGGHLTPAEVEPALRLPVVLDRARDGRNSDGGPEGDARCGRGHQDRAFGSQAMRAEIRVSKVSTSSRAYTPGSTECRSPRRTSHRIGPTRSGWWRRAMTPSLARTAWMSK